MRLDGPATELTEGQRKQAQIAGIPADRPGLGAEYPKMIYKPGGSNSRHMHLSEPLLVGNGEYDKNTQTLKPGHECQTAFVDDAEDEAAALADGWFLSPDPAEQARATAKQEIERAKDDRIAELEAMLEQQTDPKKHQAKAA